ncbi:MAG TPA: TetR/AcrR family transcriptional regulator [Thermoanaerobaculia bacterium]|nr:TetR/AcrR family transcriptional regulator [Thermoanaerobaculia bacterium]
MKRSRRMTTKKQVLEEFRCRAISAAAMRAVARKGLAKTTVDDIARAAGVAKGTLYLYFRSRDEIIEKTIGAAVDGLLEQLRLAADAAAAEPFAAALERILAAQFAYFDEHRVFFRLYFGSGEYSEDRRLRRTRRSRLHLALFVELIRRGRRRGELRSLDSERAAVAITGAAREVILRRIREKEPPPPAADARLLADVFGAGLAIPREKRG